MKIYNQRKVPAQGIRPTAVALGFFDGVHLGHRAVIEAARQQAEAQGLCLAVFTFSQPAGQPVKGRQILTTEQKHELLAQLGVHYCFEPPFESFMHRTPAQFFSQTLVEEYRARALACGDDFFFGAKRAGNTALLKTLSAEAGIALSVVPTALYDGQPVSSTRIRAALAVGDIPAANAMLGRPYEINYPVRHGNRIGGRMGFPTINQVFPDAVQPPAFGVYITQTVVDGKGWPSATGYGTRPTVDDGAPTCETFIPGYEGDLYDKPIRVRFYKKIDTPKKFESLEALAQAVDGWAAASLHFFEKEGGHRL
ncbi:MAG: riboflavin biosynthesis protein RibF [Oscillospiraceae bacterium]